MKFTLAVFLLCSMAWGQQCNLPHQGMSCGSGGAPGIPSTAPPLKCGQYQHAQEEHFECGLAGNGSTCDKFVPARCVDDMHVVTEREWQDLMKRLTTLEEVEETNRTEIIGMKLKQEDQP